MGAFNPVTSLLTLVMVVVYIGLTFWLTIRLRSKTSKEFMVGGRAMPAIVVAILLVSEFIGATATVGTSQKAFEAGLAASWAILAAAPAFWLFGRFFVQRVYSSTVFTISGAIEKKYGLSTKRTVSIIVSFALLLANCTNYIGGAAALSAVVPININLAMIIIAFASTFYFAFGGLKGVAWVTLLHTALKVGGMMTLTATALILSKGMTPMIQNLPHYYFSWDGKVGISTMIAWTIGVVGAMFAGQHVFQAVASNKSLEDARRSCYYAAIFSLPIGLMIGIIGVASRYLYPNINSLYALPVFLTKMPPVLGALIATSLVASVFVSVSTTALAITSLVVQDFYDPWANPTPEGKMRATRWISLAIGLLPLLLVFFLPAILKVSFFSRALRVSVTIVAMIGFTLPFFASNRGATWGLIGSAVATTTWFLLGDPFGIDNMYIAVVMPVLVMAIERIVPGNRAPPAGAVNS